jgi:FAD/FMN-containing dehydrogenase
MMGEMASYSSIPDDIGESFFCARQSEVIPACVVRPLTPQDASVAIKAISKHSCHFAIKSGGHAMFPGASNADGGITIDLKHLNGMELSEDLATARIGPGNRWGAVYEVLEPLGLTVVGGRVGHVGVGGFMLGGKSHSV